MQRAKPCSSAGSGSAIERRRAVIVSVAIVGRRSKAPSELSAARSGAGRGARQCGSRRGARGSCGAAGAAAGAAAAGVIGAAGPLRASDQIFISASLGTVLFEAILCTSCCRSRASAECWSASGLHASGRSSVSRNFLSITFHFASCCGTLVGSAANAAITSPRIAGASRSDFGPSPWRDRSRAIRSAPASSFCHGFPSCRCVSTASSSIVGTSAAIARSNRSRAASPPPRASRGAATSTNTSTTNAQ